MKNTISLFNGTVIINKAKMDMLVSKISYASLYVVRVLLCIAAVIFLFLTAVAASDGKMNDVYTMTMLYSFAIALACLTAALIVSYLMNAIADGYRSRQKVRRAIQKKDLYLRQTYDIIKEVI